MGIVNKRNAVLGWLTWNVGKRVARKKAKAAVPAIEGGKPNKPASVAFSSSGARRRAGAARAAQAVAPPPHNGAREVTLPPRTSRPRVTVSLVQCQDGDRAGTDHDPSA